MKQTVLPLFLAFLTSWPISFFQEQPNVKPETLTADAVIQNMFESATSTNVVQFEMTTRERIDGELVNNYSYCLMQYVPKKIFMRGLDEKGTLQNEVLYIEGENDNEALISPNGFPFINLSLNPLGGTMRKGHHFTLLEAGGRHLVNMLRQGMEKSADMPDRQTRMEVINMEGDFIQLIITNPDYGFKPFTCETGSTLRSVSQQLGVPEYKLMEMNDNIDDWDESLTGAIIQVPNYYAKKIELTIRTTDYIPMNVRIFDDVGLYSEYAYKSFDRNPKITDLTFSRDNPAYTF